MQIFRQRCVNYSFKENVTGDTTLIQTDCKEVAGDRGYTEIKYKNKKKT